MSKNKDNYEDGGFEKFKGNHKKHDKVLRKKLKPREKYNNR